MPAKILTPIPAALEQAAHALLHQQVVGMPTETVYGLAGLGTDENALLKIFQVKERPLFDPLILHIHSSLKTLESLDQMDLISLQEIPSAFRSCIQKLMNQFWPGPLSLVLPRGKAVPDLATSGLPNVALRMPKHPVAQALLEKTKLPLAAPSANRFGRISPTTAQAVAQELGEKIELILDGGPCEIGLESSVVLFSEKQFYLLRPGAIGKKELEACLGQTFLSLTELSQNQEPQLPSPGLLDSHYAPRKPLYLNTQLPWPAEKAPARCGILALSPKSARAIASRLPLSQVHSTEVLSAHPLDDEAAWKQRAARLFSGLRALDQNSEVEWILAECPEADEGLAFAIRDRLERASGLKRS